MRGNVDDGEQDEGLHVLLEDVDDPFGRAELPAIDQRVALEVAGFQPEAALVELVSFGGVLSAADLLPGWVPALNGRLVVQPAALEAAEGGVDVAGPASLTKSDGGDLRTEQVQVAEAQEASATHHGPPDLSKRLATVRVEVQVHGCVDAGQSAHCPDEALDVGGVQLGPRDVVERRLPPVAVLEVHDEPPDSPLDESTHGGLSDDSVVGAATSVEASHELRTLQVQRLQPQDVDHLVHYASLPEALVGGSEHEVPEVDVPRDVGAAWLLSGCELVPVPEVPANVQRRSLEVRAELVQLHHVQVFLLPEEVGRRCVHFG